MKSDTTTSCNDERFFLSELLIRIRRSSIRPAVSDREVLDSSTCDAPSEIERDVEEIRRRARSEGLSFFTKALPQFGKAIDMALLGNMDSFGRIPFRKGNDVNYPELFRGLTSRVFDAQGVERSDACQQSVRLLRQLTYSFYKLDVPYADETKDEILRSFVQVDAALPSSFAGFARPYGSSIADYEQRCADLPSGISMHLDSQLGATIQAARYIIGSVLGSCDPRDIRPRHGPGAVATGEDAIEKSNFTLMYDRLERVYPFTEYMRYNLTHVLDTYDNPPEYKEHGTAKVVLVPKDSRGPRLISCEPLASQWIQQGQMKAIVTAIENHRLTSGQVNFSDQTINGSLALESSLTGGNATLDMKDASDRVSWALIELLFPIHWIEALWASRSPETELPNGKIVRLKKFAPMGSAVCFPVEALVFFALSVGAVYSKRRRVRHGGQSLELSALVTDRQDRREIEKISKTIYVYGDDLICPTEDSGSVIATLECFALRFNTQKCCTTGSFRESCGVDAYKGVNVTPVRFRTRPGTSLLSPDALVSWVEYSNSLYEKGYVECAHYIQDWICTYVWVPTLMFKDIKKRLGGICFIRHYPGSLTSAKLRYNKKLQRTEVRLLVVRPVTKRAKTLGWEEMLRSASLTAPTCRYDSLREPSYHSAGIHALPRRYKLTRGWVPLS